METTLADLGGGSTLHDTWVEVEGRSPVHGDRRVSEPQSVGTAIKNQQSQGLRRTAGIDPMPLTRPCLPDRSLEHSC
jgi:hypothetical protein